MDKKKLLIGVCILLFLLVLSNSLAREEASDKKPGIASQFIGSFKCILTDCGWPAIVILILPAIAIYVYKKIFAWG